MANSPSFHVIYQRYLVGLFDAVGQSNVFQSYSSTGASSVPQRELDALALEAANFQRWCRRGLLQLFRDAPLAKDPRAPYDRDLKTIETLLEPAELEFEHFRDWLMPYATVESDAHGLPLLGQTFRLLYSAGVMFVTSLAHGRPLRGGFEVDGAAKVDEEHLYGKAVDEALALEARVAAYPRLVIGRALHAEITRLGRLEGADPFVSRSRALATHLQSWITLDDDRQAILHYLGDAFLESAAPITKDIRLQAYDTLLRQAAHWRDAQHPALQDKYRRLQSYWDRSHGRRDGPAGGRF